VKLNFVFWIKKFPKNLRYQAEYIDQALDYFVSFVEKSLEIFVKVYSGRLPFDSVAP
jgi:hypothetical protein